MLTTRARLGKSACQVFRSERNLHFATPRERAGERHLIGVFEVAAHRYSLRDPGYSHAERLDEPCEVQRRRFSLDRRIGRDDDLLHGPAREPFQKFLELELIRTYSVERRKRTVEHMVATVELARALHGEEIGYRLDHADDLVVAPRVAADAARILRGEIAADRAEPHLALEGEERLGEIARVLRRSAQDVEGEALRRLLADAGKLCEEQREPADRVGNFQGIIPGNIDLRFASAPPSLCTRVCTARRAALVAATIRSSSIATSFGSTTFLSICTRVTSPAPLAVTITIPPPAVPWTSRLESSSCVRRSCSWMACACWKSASISKPCAMITPRRGPLHPRSRRREPLRSRARKDARAPAAGAAPFARPSCSPSLPRGSAPPTWPVAFRRRASRANRGHQRRSPRRRVANRRPRARERRSGCGSRPPRCPRRGCAGLPSPARRRRSSCARRGRRR